MKLIIQGTRIVATAGDGYTGPEKYCAAPVGFTPERMNEYSFVNGALVQPTIPDIQVYGRKAMQVLLDTRAAERGYGSDEFPASMSIVTYANDKEPRFKKEAEIFLEYRSTLWKAGYQLIGEIQLGMRPMPTDLSEVLVLLPQLDWAAHEHEIPALGEVELPPPAPPPAPPPVDGRPAPEPDPAPEPEGEGEPPAPTPEPEPEPGEEQP